MEKILFSNNFNQTEYLRTMAKLGHNTFALRVMSDVEICSYILEHGSKLPDGTFITSKEENYILYHLTGGDFNDAKNIRSAIDSYRDCVIGDITESLKSNLTNDFPDKKVLIMSKYQEYVEYKKNHNLYDKQDLMNYILSSDIKLDIEVIYYEEFGISNLFLTMLNKVFNKVTNLSLNDTFNKKEKDIHFMKAYGKPCEADYIFSIIQKYPIDECQIILTNNSDALEIYKTMEMLHIPYTSHIGTPIISSKAGSLLNYLFDLERLSFGVDGYKALFNSPSFNTQPFKDLIPSEVKKPDREFSDFIKYAGWLRLNFDNKPNDVPDVYDRDYHYQMLVKLAESLSKGRAEFIKEYILDPTQLDLQIIESIKRIEEASKIYGFDMKDVLMDYLSGSISKKVSESGHLYIADVNSALSSLRKHNFIIGLTSDFPGGPKENYLIFDEEYENTGSDLYISTSIVKRKEKVLRSLIDASEDIYLTYPYFDLASLEDKNPSSVIFDLYPGDPSNIPSYGYKDMKLSINKEVYQARLNNLKSDLPKNSTSLPYDKDKLLNKNYSPSKMYEYFEEEKKLSFILSCILEIDMDDTDDPYTLIPRNELGNIIHTVFEKFQKNKVSLVEIKDKANREFDKFLKKKPPMILSSVKNEKDNYMRLIENLYDMDPNNAHIKSEQYVAGSIGGINFSGYLDRLEQDKFGKYILVDYKTGVTPSHKDEDPITCLQGLIYAYILEEHPIQIEMNSISIDRIEFRYPENKDTITITYNNEHKTALINLMKEFKDDIENGTIFKHLEEKQKYIEKFSHLFSLMKGVNLL